MWGKSWKRFGNLQNMSTYLVAMVVGEFDMISNLIKEGIVVSVYTAPEQSARGRFAIDVATKALSFFTETFGIPYPLKNWQMQRVQFVTYYPISGFAQFDAAHHIYPESKLWDTFVQDVMLGSAFVKDAMISSHPDEADEIFNAFSYHKDQASCGCCTNICGYSTVVIGKGVWSKIENMADTWTKQVGFPLVTVKQDADGHCIFQQERFLTDSSLNVDDNSLRDIPLTSAHRMILIRSIVLNFETQKPQR
ncbi:putative peptidase M1, alanine aminopeptidase/leukotriene A4 hydrolase [Plasmopara halstedii]